MLIMGYPSIRGEYLPDRDKKATWNLLHAYIDSHNQIIFDECTGDVVQAIIRLNSKCVNMTFSEQSRYNSLFQQVINKG